MKEAMTWLRIDPKRFARRREEFVQVNINQGRSVQCLDNDTKAKASFSPHFDVTKHLAESNGHSWRLQFTSSLLELPLPHSRQP